SARADVLEWPSHASELATFAEAAGDLATSRWLETLTGAARDSLDFVRLERLKAKGDAAWESLFDALQDRGAKFDSVAHSRASDAYLQADLPRPAFRHWEETPRQLHARLLSALWKAELTSAYASAVDSIRTRWIESPPRDWTWVGTAVELALAR